MGMCGTCRKVTPEGTLLDYIRAEHPEVLRPGPTPDPAPDPDPEQ